MREIGSFYAVFKKKPGEFGLQERLESVEAQVYRLVDGRRNIIQLAILSRQSRFDTAKILRDLVRKQRVELVSLPRARAPEKKVSLLPKILFGGLIFILVVILSTGVVLFLRGYARMGEVGRAFRNERLLQAQEIYRLEKGFYNENLEQLVKEGLLSEKDLQFFQKVK